MVNTEPHSPESSQILPEAVAIDIPPPEAMAERAPALPPDLQQQPQQPYPSDPMPSAPMMSSSDEYPIYPEDYYKMYPPAKIDMESPAYPPPPPDYYAPYPYATSSLYIPPVGGPQPLPNYYPPTSSNPAFYSNSASPNLVQPTYVLTPVSTQQPNSEFIVLRPLSESETIPTVSHPPPGFVPESSLIQLTQLPPHEASPPARPAGFSTAKKVVLGIATAAFVLAIPALIVFFPAGIGLFVVGALLYGVAYFMR